MKTIIETASPESIARAAEIIKNGGLVAFPTETVYGLGANGLDGESAERVFRAKGRPADNPLILHISNMEMVYELTSEVSVSARKLIDAFWPGALTLILPKKAHVPCAVSCGLGTVGVRMPSHPVACGLIQAAGLPIAAPSANLSGSPSPTLAEHVEHDLNGKIDMILDGGACGWGLESTVAEVLPNGLCILRPGAVTIEQLRNVVANVWFDKAAEGPVNSGFIPKAPGMKYRHYSPKAEVVLVIGSESKATKYILLDTINILKPEMIGILTTEQSFGMYTDKGFQILSLGDRDHPETTAASLFRCLREFDLLGVKKIYAEGIDESGLGFTVMNRLRKAATKVVEL